MTVRAKTFYGGIDAGGTTFKCGIFDADLNIIDRRRIAVTTPQETVEACIAFFRHSTAARSSELAALGIASFGPADIDPGSSSYGTILETPKQGWSQTPVLQMFRSALDVRVVFNTDVNGALDAERLFGAAYGASCAAYLTIGTGIGGSVWSLGGYAGYPSHMEFGHIPVARHERDTDYRGVCRFHSDCLEGLASAASVEARFGDPRKLERTHTAWEVEAYYLAQACRVIYLSFRTEKIVLGGGLMLAPGLLSKVRDRFVEQMDGYAGASPRLAEDMIVTAGLGDDAGLIGSGILAMSELVSSGGN